MIKETRHEGKRPSQPPTEPTTMKTKKIEDNMESLRIIARAEMKLSQEDVLELPDDEADELLFHFNKLEEAGIEIMRGPDGNDVVTDKDASRCGFIVYTRKPGTEQVIDFCFKF